MPAGRHRVEDVIQRSRFITTVARAPSSDDAHAFVQSIRDEFPDATHNCWAFVAGPPDPAGHTTYITVAWPWQTPIGCTMAFVFGYLLARPRLQIAR